MGLCGEVPDSVDTSSIAHVATIRRECRLTLLGQHEVSFDMARDLLFNRTDELPVHTNGMRFQAWNADAELLDSRELYSVGGGFGGGCR